MNHRKAAPNYLGQLKTALRKLTSTQAKTDLTALISALTEATSTSSATKVAAAASKLSTDCL